jgi:hypothetical protein
MIIILFSTTLEQEDINGNITVCTKIISSEELHIDLEEIKTSRKETKHFKRLGFKTNYIR